MALIGNLQILRAFAATGVVILHSNATIFGIHTQFYGVALFFVLSGFLMPRMRERSPSEFAMDRIWRIVPAYWLAIAVLLTTFSMWTYWPASHTALSFLFIPHQSPGGLYPVLGVGWTLNLEMYFYAVFAASMAINRRYSPVIAAATIAAVFFSVPHITANEAVNFYYGGYFIWFFVAGILIWYLTEWLALARSPLRLPKSTLPVSLAIYSMAAVAAGFIWPSADAFEPAIVLASVLFLVAVLAAQCGADLKQPFLMLLGNASYACYLLHTILIELMRHRGIDVDGGILLTAWILVSSWTVAIMWHLTVENLVIIAKRRIKASRLPV